MAPNYDFDMESADLTRRQKIADALQGASLSPMEMPSAPGVKLSPLHAVTKLIQAYMGGQQSRGIKDERTAMGERYQRELGAGMEKFSATSQGTPGTPGMPGMPEMGPPTEAGGMQPEVPSVPGMPAVPGNRRKAVMDAIASNHPVLKEMGMKEFAEMSKANAPIAVDKLLPYADPNSIPGMVSGGTAAFKPKQELKTVDNIVFDANTKEIVQLKGPTPTQIRIDGALYQPNLSTKQLEKLDKTPQVNIDNGGGNAFGKAIASTRASTLQKSFESAQTLPQTLSSINDATNALESGVKSGITGEIALGMAKVGKALGLGDVDPAIANTEQYRSSVAQSVLKVLEKLKPASDTDVKFAQEVAGGKITLDDKTMMRLLDTAKAATWNAHLAHDSLIENNMKAPGGAEAGLDAFRVALDIKADATKFDYNPSTRQFSVKNSGIPANGGKGTKETPLTLDEYIKSKKGPK